MKLQFMQNINQLAIYTNELSIVDPIMNVQIFLNLPSMKSESLLAFARGMFTAQANITKCLCRVASTTDV